MVLNQSNGFLNVHAKINFLDIQATKIFQKILDRLGDRDFVKISALNGFMPLSVDSLGTKVVAKTKCKVVALAQNYIQNGDVMADPDMEFYIFPDGKIAPYTFQNDGMGVFQKSIYASENEIDASLQKDHTIFANMWLKNLDKQLIFDKVKKYNKPIQGE